MGQIPLAVISDFGEEGGGGSSPRCEAPSKRVDRTERVTALGQTVAPSIRAFSVSSASPFFLHHMQTHISSQ
jgi:hypothetical protein